MSETTTNVDVTTLGERIAAEFSRDKVSLSDAERRRLAGMIDERTVDAMALAKMFKEMGDADLLPCHCEVGYRCNVCQMVSKADRIAALSAK